MKKYILGMLILFIGVSCTPIIDLTEDIPWLEGKWKRDFNGVAQIESWQKGEFGFTGQNLFLANGDTTLMNTMDIMVQGDNWVMTRTMFENDIQFTYGILHSNTDSVVFQNNENIWPQTITYKHLSDEKLELIVDGMDGTMRKNVAFTFTKN